MSLILVVDDSELVSHMVKEFLTSHGYDVWVAQDAEQGYQLLSRQIPDLVLLDVQLPDVTGFEFCKVLRSHPATRALPIIMMTGTAIESANKVKGLQAGADDYVQKPFDNEELLERIRAVLRRSPAPVAIPEPQEMPELEEAPASKIALTGPRLSIGKALKAALFNPLSLVRTSVAPGLSLSYLFAMAVLVISGLALAAGTTWQPVSACAVGILLWIAVVTVAVVAASFVGMSLHWNEGAMLVSLAGVPLLLKLAGGCAVAALTSLSPFLYQAGPSLLFSKPPFWLFRADIFELWSLGLFARLLAGRPGAGKVKAAVVSLVVWIAAVAFLLSLERFRA